MLTAYLNQTRRLLQNPPAPVSLYSDADLTDYINIARGQLAGDGECIRVRATIPTVVGQRPYNFSSLNTGVAATNGVRGAMYVRSMFYGVGDGQKWMTPRPWEWFELYALNNAIPANAVPTTWSQYGQGSAGTSTGSAATGSFYLDPAPDAIYTLYCDSVCYPIALVDNTTVEAIPYLWTDAVPFFAAYFALLSAQTSARQADAERLYGHYETFVQRARKSANPSVLRWQYQQATDPAQMAKLGLQAPRQGAA